MMTNINKVLLLFVALILLSSCKASDKYAGDWYAVSDSDEEVMINFSDKRTMTISAGENEQSFKTMQTGTGFVNSTRYFKVMIEGSTYYVVFDDGKDEDNAKFVKQTNQADDFEDVVGDVVYLMNRNDYPAN